MKVTTKQVAQVLVEATKLKSQLIRVFSRPAVASAYRPGFGSTVDVKLPPVLEKGGFYSKAKRDAGETIAYSRFLRERTPLTLDEQAYIAVPITDEELTFEIEDFSREVLQPMAENLSEQINDHVGQVLAAVPSGLTAVDKAKRGTLVTDKGTVLNPGDDIPSGEKVIGAGAGVTVKASDLKAKTHKDVRKVVRNAKKLFSQRGVSKMNRYIICDSEWAQAFESDPDLYRADRSGTTETLRENEVGRLNGFTIIEDATLPPNVAYAVQEDAIAAVLVPAAVPEGASFGTVTNLDGYNVRYIHDYDTDRLQDRAVLSTFVGAGVLDPQRIVKLEGTDGFSEPEDVTPTAPAGAAA